MLKKMLKISYHEFNSVLIASQSKILYYTYSKCRSNSGEAVKIWVVWYRRISGKRMKCSGERYGIKEVLPRVQSSQTGTDWRRSCQHRLHIPHHNQSRTHKIHKYILLSVPSVKVSASHTHKWTQFYLQSSRSDAVTSYKPHRWWWYPRRERPPLSTSRGHLTLAPPRSLISLRLADCLLNPQMRSVQLYGVIYRRKVNTVS